LAAQWYKVGYIKDINMAKSKSNKSEMGVQSNATAMQASKGVSAPAVGVTQLKETKTGLPGNIKSGVEGLSGMSMDDVKVHRNSSKPAEIQAHAYAMGNDIHVAPGQEKHLPHEAWHVVQQKQGRVQANMQLKGGVNVNADQSLEQEADVMGSKAIAFANTLQPTTQRKSELGVQSSGLGSFDSTLQPATISAQPVAQRVEMATYFRNYHLANDEAGAIKNAGFHNGAMCTSVENTDGNRDKIKKTKGRKNEDISMPNLSYWKVNKQTKKANKVADGTVEGKTNEEKEVYHIHRS
jgi:hypothetical protein